MATKAAIIASTSLGVRLIARERDRQIFDEGFDGDHDDDHNGGELISAAQAYLSAGRAAGNGFDIQGYYSDPPATWPWDSSGWKPSQHAERNLVKAAALVCAEIDRLSRKALAGVTFTGGAILTTHKEECPDAFVAETMLDQPALTDAPKPSALDVQVGGSHYKDMAIQPVVFCQMNRLPSIESNVVKYVCRHRFKGGRKDIEKAIHNLQILLEMEYPEEEDGQ